MTRAERFVRTFIRPHGIDVDATPVLVSALEQLAASGPRARVHMALSSYPLRAVLWLCGFVAVYRSPTRIVKVVRRSGFALKTKVRTAMTGRAEASERDRQVGLQCFTGSVPRVASNAVP